MNSSGYVILSAVFLVETIEILISVLNMRHVAAARKHPPGAVLKFTDEPQLDRALAYHLAKEKPRLISRIAQMPVFYALFISGLLVSYAELVDRLTPHETLRAVVFMASFFLLFMLTSLPGKLYHTFVVEKRFGFGRYTKLRYLKDKLVMVSISLVIITILLFLIITGVHLIGWWWWLYAAILVSLFLLVIQYIYPAYIAPLFNKYERLDDEPLRHRIQGMAEKEGISLDNIYRVDASRRSTHANALLVGIGSKVRILLYDTLLDNYSTEDVEAILAHEIGHQKLHHLWKELLVTGLSFFAALFLMGLLINESFIYEAFGFNQSAYIGIFLVAVLLSPLRAAAAPMLSFFSRRREYAADRFAAALLGDKKQLIQSVVKLNKGNLSNPLPHPLYSACQNSHPTLLERVAALERL